jgi:hypothetical protein
VILRSKSSVSLKVTYLYFTFTWAICQFAYFYFIRKISSCMFTLKGCGWNPSNVRGIRIAQELPYCLKDFAIRWLNLEPENRVTPNNYLKHTNINYATFFAKEQGFTNMKYVVAQLNRLGGRTINVIIWS